MEYTQLKNKFSKHIGRILLNVETTEDKQALNDYIKGELWLLCEDLIIMLDIKETNDGMDKNTNR